MSGLSDAIARGIRSGIETAAMERCTGRNDPEDRCPMRPKDGCICAYRAWQKLPWWRRLFQDAPIRPTVDAVLSMTMAEAMKSEGIISVPHRGRIG